ncbi:hypothetical protein LTR17_027874, partial [Elasticomyces elasticus]
DVDMEPKDRLVVFNGLTMPWRGDMQLPLERALSRRSLRVWEGRTLPHSFHLPHNATQGMRDVAFQQEAASQLGDLGLVRLDGGRESTAPEVEISQGGATITCSPAESTLILERGDLIPIIWEFRQLREGPSDRYRPFRWSLRIGVRKKEQGLRFKRMALMVLTL